MPCEPILYILQKSRSFRFCSFLCVNFGPFKASEYGMSKSHILAYAAFWISDKRSSKLIFQAPLSYQHCIVMWIAIEQCFSACRTRTTVGPDGRLGGLRVLENSNKFSHQNSLLQKIYCILSTSFTIKLLWSVSPNITKVFYINILLGTFPND
jgi:hypothetical protein